MKILILLLGLFLVSCVTVNARPPDIWMNSWEKCFHDPFCDTNNLIPWYAMDYEEDLSDTDFLKEIIVH